MARDKSTLSLAMSALSTGGFVKHTHTPFNNAAASASPHAPPAESRFFDYTPAPIEYRNRILNKLETGDHIVRYVRFPSAGLTRQPGGLVHAHYWHGKRPGQKPLLIVLPIFGSYTYPTEAMVRTIRRHYGGDCHVLQIVGENYLLDWFGLAEVDSYEALTAKADEMAEHMRIAVIDLK
ncbi:MAG TPA: hypothetical protein VFK45_10380, partial [Gammaproteobacteria bacterium]|nr:hypothetical protein [Gammaproteobacteria bacterium]